MQKYLFLDFDGVLHSDSSGRADFDLKNNLLPIIKEHSFNIVISSSWRTCYSISGLKQLLGNELSKFVIGVTPDLSLISEASLNVMDYSQSHHENKGLLTNNLYI